jgi:hypothetical protein
MDGRVPLTPVVVLLAATDRRRSSSPVVATVRRRWSGPLSGLDWRRPGADRRAARVVSAAVRQDRS